MRRHSTKLATVGLAVLLLFVNGGLPGSPARAAADDLRLFAETGFRVGNDHFWEYFQRRGGLRTFGFPISRGFYFQGLPVQFFQREIMQEWPDGTVHVLNLLDPGLLPYTTINGSTFPGPDPAFASAAPDPSEAGYAEKMLDFARERAPDTWKGMPVVFFKTYSTTITYQDAFPNGDGPANLVPLLNLEIWGAPTSAPLFDPSNAGFVFQRFQRGIMHYSDACHCTQGLLLADYFKSILTGENLPVDLEAQAGSSPFFRQYDPTKKNSIARPKQLDQSDLTDAFSRDDGSAPVGAQPTSKPAKEKDAKESSCAVSSGSTRSNGYHADSPEYGLSAFLLGHEDTTARDLKKITDLKFGWVKLLFPWRDIEGQGKGDFDWSEADRVVAAARCVNLRIIARLDFQPSWARRDGASNGPPDRYSDYSDFVSAFVSRYRQGSKNGTVDAVEIWNEVNLDREWGGAQINSNSAADYVKLLKGAYQAAKKADSAVTVVSAGMSPTGTDNGAAQPDDSYLRWIYQAGAKPYFDVLAANANVQCPCVDAAPGTASGFNHPSFYFRRVEQLRDIMASNGDSDKQAWLMEFGWTTDQIHPSYSWYATTESKKSDLIIQAFQFARKNWAPWIGVMTLWTIADPSWDSGDEQVWWAVTNPDGSTRPAYDRLLKARKDGTVP